MNYPPTPNGSTPRPYIGVLQVEAAPISLGAYVEKQGWDLPENQEASTPGYLISRKDGSLTWFPAELFEDAFLPLDPGNSSMVTPPMIEYFRGEPKASQLDAKTTLVSAECLTGFVQHEVSSCVDPDNYDEEVGCSIGTTRINSTLYQCLGFVLQWAKNGLKGRSHE